MEYHHIVAIYGRFNRDDTMEIPESILNRVKKGQETFARLTKSHADDEFIRVILFTNNDKLVEFAKGIGIPEDRIEMEKCKNIADMVNIIWSRIKNSIYQVRVHFVLSNWQWIYIEQLLRLKDEKFKFFFVGALDERSIEDIEIEKREEKVAKIGVKRSRWETLTELVGSISTDMKG